MKVVVLGATGTAGQSAVPAMVRAEHEVLAHARADRGASMLAALGATPVRGDTDDGATLRRLLTGADAVVDLRVSIPPATRAALPWAWREYTRLRGTGTAQVVDAALDVGVPRVVHDTVTMVYADGGDHLLDEDSPIDAPGPLAANIEAERQLSRLTAAGGVGVALRFGGFYGPSDEVSRGLMRSARRGRAMLLGRPDAWFSSIHTGDLGPALLTALDAPAGVYNVVDDEPLRRADMLGILAEAAGVERVRPLPTWTSRFVNAPLRALARSQRVSAGRFHALGWRPTVPSQRQGWPGAFAVLDGASEG